MDFLKVFKALLPNGRAWNLSVVSKQLHQWFVGLTDLPSDVREYFQLVLLDLYPDTTRDLERWEAEFALLPAGTEDERRARLAAAWRAIGGQSPRYLQDILQEAGFDVYLHEPFEVGGGGEKIQRDPFDFLSNTPDLIKGYLLVNNIVESKQVRLITAGSANAIAGNPSAVAGATSGVDYTIKQYDIPVDSEEWPYIGYIGAAVFPARAVVSADRKAEFETLILKYFPRQLWLGILVDYT